jgi:hypothetical protein
MLSVLPIVLFSPLSLSQIQMFSHIALPPLNEPILVIAVHNDHLLMTWQSTITVILILIRLSAYFISISSILSMVT